MKLALRTLLYVLFCCGLLDAQTLIVTPTAPIAPRGSYQSITAVVSGVNNKTVTWSTDGGTLVGVNPGTANEPNTISLYSTTSGTYHVTATSNANPSAHATATVTFTASPTVTTGWPRLLIRSSDLASMRAKATSGNPMWQAMKGQADNTLAGLTHWSLTCSGGTGLPDNTIVASVTHVNVTSGTLTVTASNGFSAGNYIMFTGLATNTWLNGQHFYISTASPTSITITGVSQANTDSADTGTVTNDVTYTENKVWLLTRAALLAPTSTDRDSYGCAAHDVWVQTMKWVIAGNINIVQGNEWAELPGGWALAYSTDWLRGAGYLTSTSDLNLARQYAATLEYRAITNIYNGTQATHCQDGSCYNSPAQFFETDENAITGMRAMGNNYTQARIMLMTAGALTFDDNPTDDPPLANTCSATRYQICDDGTAGSLHAYWRYVAGGLLYKDWANMDDPGVVQPAYNAAFSNLPSTPMCNTLWHTPISCLGQGRGGETSEGLSYGNSVGKLADAFASIYTAGYNDPMLWGPQMSLATSSYWGLRSVADLTDLMGLSGIASEKSRWTFATDGDSLNYWTAPMQFLDESSQMMLSAYTGRTDNMNTLAWTTFNSAFGMADGTAGSCTGSCGWVAELNNDYSSGTSLDAFLALPAANPVTSSPPTDPRPSIPTDLFFAGNNHIVVRDGASPWDQTSNTVYSYYCTDTQIDHEHQYCGRTDVYSKAEYITKGRMEFNNYINSESAAPSNNVMALINGASTADCGYFVDVCALGGQFWHGLQAGLNQFYHSELPAYVATVADETNSYNGGWGAFGSYNGITGASRSQVYLRAAHIIVNYDRANSSGAWNMSSYLNTTGTPTITGNQAVWTTRSGAQKAAWTSVLGGNPTLDAVYTDTEQANDWELYGRLRLNAGNVGSARFLHTLEWAPSSGFSPSTPTLVQSTAGQGFDGALTGGETKLVMFMRTRATFTGTTFPASGATTIYVSDLSPNTTYSISATGAPTSGTSDNAGVLTFAATGTGNVTLSPSGGTPAASTPTFSPAAGVYTGLQSVTISTTSGAVICYNTTGSPATNGTTGCAPGSTLYTVPVTVSASSTLYAVAGGTGFLDSPVGSAAYTINSTAAATPTFSPAAGTYIGPQSVTISTATSGATLCYTTDASTPTADGAGTCTHGTTYSGAVSVTTTTVLKAIASKTGFTDSAVGSAAYAFNLFTITGNEKITGNASFQ